MCGHDGGDGENKRDDQGISLLEVNKHFIGRAGQVAQPRRMERLPRRILSKWTGL